MVGKNVFFSGGSKISQGVPTLGFGTKTTWKQECIPVGCIPAARRKYAGVCFWGVPGPGGWVPGLGGLGGAWSRGYLVWGGAWSGGVCSRGVSAPGGSAAREVCSGGGCAPGGAWSGGCLVQGVSAPGGVCSGGVSAPGGMVGIPACTEADTPPPLWTDTRLWKYYLGPTSLRPVIKEIGLRSPLDPRMLFQTIIFKNVANSIDYCALETNQWLRLHEGTARQGEFTVWDETDDYP